MSFRHRLPLFAVLLLLLSGSAAGAADHNILSPTEASAQVAAGTMALIDVRTPEEWRQTGVPVGAMRLDYRNRTGEKQFVERIVSMVGGDRNAPLAIICRSGNRSAQVQTLLLENGFTQVVNVQEGMLGSAAGPGWLRRGLPVEPCPTC
jgi:rhodanese-related sulfurtransferase